MVDAATQRRPLSAQASADVDSAFDLLMRRKYDPLLAALRLRYGLICSGGVREEIDLATELIRLVAARTGRGAASEPSPPGPFWRVPAKLWKRMRLRILKRDRYECSYCGDSVTVETGHVDHVFPKSRGGSDHPINLTTACKRCNSSKRGATVDRWLCV